MLSLEILSRLSPEQRDRLFALWDAIGELGSTALGCRRTRYSMTELMARTIEEESFQGFIIFGGKGNGKSVYSIRATAMYYMIYEGLDCGEAYQKALSCLAFSPNDILARIEERKKIIIWDDAGVWGSTYFWYDEIYRQYIIAFINWYDVARTDVNVLLFTTPTKTKLPPKIRGDPDAILVRVSRNGYATYGGMRFKQSKAEAVKNREDLFSDKNFRELLFVDYFIVYLPDPVYEFYRIVRGLYSEFARRALKNVIDEIKRKGFYKVEIDIDIPAMSQREN